MPLDNLVIALRTDREENRNMSTSARMERIPFVSARTLARTAGVCQLLEAIAGTFGQVFVLGKLVVTGNAAATAANIVGHERLYWCGFAATNLAVILHVAWAFLMYDLLKPVNRRISIFAVFVMLMGCAMLAVTGLLYLAPLIILQSGSSLSAFTVPQLQALASAFLRLSTYAFDMHVLFFGVWCVLTGYLIFKSSFLPKLLGILLIFSGVGWTLYLSPPFAVRLFPFIAAASAIGEVPLELWLIVFGLNEARWNELASSGSTG